MILIVVPPALGPGLSSSVCSVFMGGDDSAEQSKELEKWYQFAAERFGQ